MLSIHEHANLIRDLKELSMEDIREHLDRAQSDMSVMQEIKDSFKAQMEKTEKMPEEEMREMIKNRLLMLKLKYQIEAIEKFVARKERR